MNIQCVQKIVYRISLTLIHAAIPHQLHFSSVHGVQFISIFAKFNILVYIFAAVICVLVPRDPQFLEQSYNVNQN
jgi:hypothetical protein